MAELPKDDFPIPLSIMRKHYVTGVKLRVAAKLLGRSTLEDSCKQLLELVDYVARYKYKKRLKCNFKQDQVLKTIGAHLLSIRTWAVNVDADCAQKIQYLEDGVAAALQGDKEMEKFYGVDRLPPFLITPLKKEPTLTELRALHCTSFTLAAAAAKFGDCFLKKIASTTILYLKWLPAETYPGQTLEGAVEASDVCETVKFELHQIQDLSETEVPLLEWSRRRHARMAEHLQEELDEELNDPPYVPPKSGGESSSEDSDPGPISKPPLKRPRPSGPKTSSPQPSGPKTSSPRPSDREPCQTLPGV